MKKNYKLHFLTRMLGKAENRFKMALLALISLLPFNVFAEDLFNITSYSLPADWTCTNVDGGNYFKVSAGGSMKSPTFTPHNNVEFTYKVAKFGQGTNPTLSIEVYNATTNTRIGDAITSSTPTDATYITDIKSLGNIGVPFYITLSNGTGNAALRLQNLKLTGVAAAAYTVTFNAGGGTCATSSLTESTGGAGVTLPTATIGVSGWSFAGWAIAPVGTDTSNAPELFEANTVYHPSDNIPLYAVYKKATESGNEYKVTTTLSAGNYVLGAVKAAPSTTLANNTTIGAITFSSMASWGSYTDMTPDDNGVITTTNSSAIWTLTGNNTDGYVLKNGSNYLYLKTSNGDSTAGTDSNEQTIFVTDATSTCKDAFLLHSSSSATNKLMLNTGNTFGYRMYKASQNASSSMCPYIRFYKNGGYTYNSSPSGSVTPPTPTYPGNYSVQLRYIGSGWEYDGANSTTKKEATIDANGIATFTNVDFSGNPYFDFKIWDGSNNTYYANAGTKIEANDTWLDVSSYDSYDYPNNNSFQVDIPGLDYSNVTVTVDIPNQKVKVTGTLLPHYTVSYDNSVTKWTNVKYFLKNGENDLLTRPGDAMTAPVSGSTVWTADFYSATAPTTIIFNNGYNGDGNQTSDLAFVNGKTYGGNVTLAGSWLGWGNSTVSTTAVGGKATFTVENWDAANYQFKIKNTDVNSWYGADGTEPVELANGTAAAAGGSNVKLPASADGKTVTIDFDTATNQITASWDDATHTYVMLVAEGISGSGKYYALSSATGSANNSLAAVEVTVVNGVAYISAANDNLLWEVGADNKITTKTGDYLHGLASSANLTIGTATQWLENDDITKDYYYYINSSTTGNFRTPIYHKDGYFKNYDTGNVKSGTTYGGAVYQMPYVIGPAPVLPATPTFSVADGSDIRSNSTVEVSSDGANYVWYAVTAANLSDAPARDVVVEENTNANYTKLFKSSGVETYPVPVVFPEGAKSCKLWVYAENTDGTSATNSAVYTLKKFATPTFLPEPDKDHVSKVTLSALSGADAADGFVYAITDANATVAPAADAINGKGESVWTDLPSGGVINYPSFADFDQFKVWAKATNLLYDDSDIVVSADVFTKLPKPVRADIIVKYGLTGTENTLANNNWTGTSGTIFKISIPAEMTFAIYQAEGNTNQIEVSGNTATVTVTSSGTLYVTATNTSGNFTRVINLNVYPKAELHGSMNEWNTEPYQKADIINGIATFTVENWDTDWEFKVGYPGDSNLYGKSQTLESGVGVTATRSDSGNNFTLPETAAGKTVIIRANFTNRGEDGTGDVEITATWTIIPTNDKPEFVNNDAVKLTGTQTVVAGSPVEIFAMATGENSSYASVHVVAEPDSNATITENDEAMVTITVSGPVTLTATQTNQGAIPSDPVTLVYQYPAASKPTISAFSSQLYTDDLVTITCSTEGAKIYYTIDGSEPTNIVTETCFLYNGPFTLPVGTITVKAKAYADGYRDSNIATSTYTVSAAPTFVADGARYRLVTNLDDLITTEGHNTYILAAKNGEKFLAMGDGEANRRGVLDFATEEANGDLILTKYVATFHIVNSTTPGQYLFVTEDGKYISNGAGTTDFANLSESSDQSEIEITFTANNALATFVATKDSNTVRAIRLDTASDTYKSYSTASWQAKTPALYRRVEDNEPMAPEAPVMAIDDVTVTEATAKILTTQTLTITAEPGLDAFTVVADDEHAANVAITETAIIGGVPTVYVTFTGDATITATALRMAINGITEMTATKTVSFTVPAVEAPVVTVDGTVMPGNDITILPNRTVVITTPTEGALISYSTNGSNWSTPSETATVGPVIEDITLILRATKDGYISAPERTINIMPRNSVTDEINYENFNSHSQAASITYEIRTLDSAMSGASYWGQVATGRDVSFIQVNGNRSSGHSMIMTTVSGGIAQSVHLSVNSNKQPAANHTVNIYGSHEPFPEYTRTGTYRVDDAFTNTYTKITSATISKTNTDVTIPLDQGSDLYEYILIHGPSGADYYTGITVTWDMTSNVAARKPEVTVTKKGTLSEQEDLTDSDYVEEGGVRYYNTPVVAHIAAKKAGQTLSYHLGDGNWTTTDISALDLAISGPTTIYAKASASDLEDSETVTYDVLFRPKVPDTNDTYEPVTFTPQTPGSIVLYRINEGEWKTYDADNTAIVSELTLSVPGTYFIEYKAYHEEWEAESRTLSRLITVVDESLNKPFVKVTNFNDLNSNDEIIFVSEGTNTDNVPFFVALGTTPLSSGAAFARQDVSSYKTSVDSQDAVQLPSGQQAVEIFKLKIQSPTARTAYFETTVANAGKYLTSGTSDKTKLHLSNPNDDSELPNALAVITLDSNDETPTVKFEGTGTAKILTYNANKGSERFGSYVQIMKEIDIYRRGIAGIEQVARPVPSVSEGYYEASEFPTALTLSCETEGATIYYTIDGTSDFISQRYNGNPTESIKIFHPGDAPITITDGMVVHAYATKTGMLPSYQMICAYHKFDPGKKYRRVRYDEIQTLKLGDNVIVVASPSGSNDYYAMGRVQVNAENAKYRAAVKLNSAALSEISQGVITLNDINVQPLNLLSGVDDYDGFDWRLYASGTYERENPTDSMEDTQITDGYLYSGGPDNTLETKRVADYTSELIANTDTRLLSYHVNRIGNEYGGVTMQFDSPDGNQEKYPNYMGLRHLVDTENGIDLWKFNCYTIEQMGDEVEGYTDPIYHVSLYRLYDAGKVLMPILSHDGGEISSDWGLTISCPTPQAEIYYQITEAGQAPAPNAWVRYTDGNNLPIATAGEYITIHTYAEDAYGVLDASDINSQTYHILQFEFYELVRTRDEIRPSDRFIFVNTMPTPDGGDEYWVMTNDVYSNQHYRAKKVDSVLVPEGEPNRLIIPADVNSGIMVFTVEDAGESKTEGIAGERQWLLKVITGVDENNHYIYRYASPAGTRSLYPAWKADGSDKTMPKKTYFTEQEVTEMTTAERANITSSIFIKDYKTTDQNGGDFIYYSNSNGHTSQTKGDVKNSAEVIFSYKENAEADPIQTIMRFNIDGPTYHFNVYHLKDENVIKTGNDADGYQYWVTSNNSTWPVSIYRAVKTVMTPSITIYPSTVNYEDGTVTYNTNAAAPGVVDFRNPVKIVIKSNPRSAADAAMGYAWSRTETDVPLLAEYRRFDSTVNTVTIYLDGFKATCADLVHALPEGMPTEADLKTLGFSNEAGWLESTIRAIAAMRDENDNLTYSPSVVRGIHFFTTAPEVRTVSTSAEGTVARVQRPSVYTLGAKLYYLISDNGDAPVIVYNEDGTVNEDASTISGLILPSTSAQAQGTLGDDYTVTVPAGKKLVVGAYKYGYEPKTTEFKANNYYADVRPIQLVELTDEGRTFVEGKGHTPRRYLTYRTGQFEHEHYYLIDLYEEGEQKGQIKHIDHFPAKDAYEIFGMPDPDVTGDTYKSGTQHLFNWTPNFYVMALNYTDMFNSGVVPNTGSETVGDTTVPKAPDSRYLTVTLKDGDIEGINCTPVTLSVPAEYDLPEEERIYYGAIVDRNGMIGRRFMEVTLDYQIDTEDYQTISIEAATPFVPKAYIGHFRYQTNQYTVEDGRPEQNLEKRFPGKEFLKFKVPSSVDNIPDQEVLIPTKDLDPRQVDVILSFDRPNISDDILAHYDIFYTITFESYNRETGLTKTLPGGGIYSDTQEDNLKVGSYEFAFEKVHPQVGVYPVMKVLQTEYVQNHSTLETYGSYTANYGYYGPDVDDEMDLVIRAQNAGVRKAPALNNGLDLAYIEPQKTVFANDPSDYNYQWFRFAHTNESADAFDWMYKGHGDLKDSDDITGGTADGQNTPGVDDQTTDENKVLSPAYYHIEAYTGTPGVGTQGVDYDYASYDYLVQHVDDHNKNMSKDKFGFYDGDLDPLKGTIIAKGFKRTSGKTIEVSVDGTDQTKIINEPELPHVVFAPIYIFWHKPAPDNEITDSETPHNITTLQLVSALPGSVGVAPASAPAKAPIARAESTEDAGKPSDKSQPMPVQGVTDKNHSLIQDMSLITDLVPVKGGYLDVDTAGDGGIVTGVEDVNVDHFEESVAGDTIYYNIQGVRVVNPTPGIYLVRRGNVVVKEIIK